MSIKISYPLAAERIEIGGITSLFAVGTKEGRFKNPVAQKEGFRHAGLDLRDEAGTNRLIIPPEQCTIVKLLRYVPDSDGYGPSVIILKSVDTPVRYHFLAHLDRNSQYWKFLYVGKKVDETDILGEYDPQMNHVHWEIRPAVSWQGQRDKAGNYLNSQTKWISNYSPMHFVNRGLLVRGDQLTEPGRLADYLSTFTKKGFPWIEDNSYSEQHDKIALDNRPAWIGAVVPNPPTTPPGTPATPDDDRQTPTASTGAGISIFALAAIGVGAYFLMRQKR